MSAAIRNGNAIDQWLVRTVQYVNDVGRDGEVHCGSVIKRRQRPCDRARGRIDHSATGHCNVRQDRGRECIDNLNVLTTDAAVVGDRDGIAE